MYCVPSMVYVRLHIYVYTVLPNVYLYYYICYYTTDVTTIVVSLTYGFKITMVKIDGVSAVNTISFVS